MVDLHFGLHRYLYAFFLICLSATTHALTDLEKSMNGFAENTVCSHPTDLNFCAKVSEGDAENKACGLYFNANLASQNSNREYTGSYTVSTSTSGTKRCDFPYKIKDSTTTGVFNQALITRSAMCPVKEAPPPEIVKFSRQGRWFPQELSGTRCYRNCEYSNGQSFSAKHFVFTNGVVTEFTEDSSNRLKSKQLFCNMLPEPIRNSDGETTYDANCDDAFLTVFCEFVEWYRSDAEMPEAPKPEHNKLEIGSLDGSRINLDIATYQCLPAFERDFTMTIMGKSYTHHASVDLYPICSKLYEMGNFFRIFYLITGAFIIFRK